MRLDGEMENLFKVRMVDMRKDPEEVFVDVFCSVRE